MLRTIRLEKIIVRKLKMRMKQPFVTSYGAMQDKEFLLVEAIDQSGQSGWGESVAMDYPWYTEETVKTTEHMLEDVLIPIVFETDIEHPDRVSHLFAPIRRNNMAKAALEGAVWDLFAKKQGISLAKALGGNKTVIDVGISMGLQDSFSKLKKQIEEKLKLGYKRFKFKVKPGQDIDYVDAIRQAFPTLSMMVDANSAYTLEDIWRLQQFDQFQLMMIEQPLAHDDLIDHARLQKQLKTPICLDESIHSLDDVRHALELGSCQVINIKIGRVGGLTEAKRIHDFCRRHGVAVWCGGMLEAGVGRAHNIAVTTLSQFTLPGDTAGSSHYWYEDIIDPEVMVVHGQIRVSERPGIGYEVNRQVVANHTMTEKIFHR